MLGSPYCISEALPSLIMLTLSPVGGSGDEGQIGINQQTKHRYLVTSSARSSWSAQSREVTTVLAHIPFLCLLHSIFFHNLKLMYSFIFKHVYSLNIIHLKLTPNLI